MKDINVDVVPLLENRGIINGECVAMGVIDQGVLIHYLERDKARIIEWEDIVNLGLSDVLSTITDATLTNGHEIEGPTPE